MPGLFPDTANLEFEVVDVLQPDVTARSFDALLDRGCLHGITHWDKRQAYVKTVTSWARPGAAYVLLSHCRHSNFEQLKTQIKQLFGAHFDIADVRPWADRKETRAPGALFHLVRHGAISQSD